MRYTTLTIAEAEAAIRRAETVSAAWRARFPLEDDGWQAIAVELAAIPKVWRAVWRARGRTSYYQPIQRVTAYGLPGYVMTPWNGMPREDYQTAHAPGVVYDGLRREVADFWPLYVVAMAMTGRLEERVKLNYGYVNAGLASLGIRAESTERNAA